MDATEFFLLARKVAGRKATTIEREQLDAIIKAHPELRADFDDIKREAGWKETTPNANAPLVPPDIDDDADEAERQRAVEEEEKAFRRQRRSFNWRKWLKMASIMAAMAVLFWPDISPSPAKTVLAINVVRGTNAVPEVVELEYKLIKNTWPGVALTTADNSADIKTWENDWPEIAPDRPIVKVIYDRPANQIRVSGLNGPDRFQRTFPVAKGLPVTLKEVDAYITSELR